MKAQETVPKNARKYVLLYANKAFRPSFATCETVHVWGRSALTLLLLGWVVGMCHARFVPRGNGYGHH